MFTKMPTNSFCCRSVLYLLPIVLTWGCAEETDDSTDHEQIGTSIRAANDPQNDPPNAPPTDGLHNIKPEGELEYVSRLGFLDGTTCESWPLSVSLRDTWKNVDSLKDIIGRHKDNMSGKSLEQIQKVLEEQDVAEVSAIGSKRELLIVKAKGAGPKSNKSYSVAVDLKTRTGHTLDAQWFCTEEDEKAGECMTTVVKIDTVSNVEVLHRKEAQKKVRTAMLVAPKIRVPESIILDMNVILVAQYLIGGASMSGNETLKDRKGHVSLQVSPWINKSNWKKAVSPDTYEPGMLIAIATETGGFASLRTVPGHIGIITIDNDNPDAKVARNEIRVTPEEALPFDFGQWFFNEATSEANSWLECSTTDEEGDPTCYHNNRRYYDAQINLKSPAPVATEARSGGAVIVIAGDRNDDLLVSAEGTDITKADISDEALEAYVDDIFEALDEAGLDVDHEPHVRTDVEGLDDNCIDIMANEDTPWEEVDLFRCIFHFYSENLGCTVCCRPNKYQFIIDGVDEVSDPIDKPGVFYHLKFYLNRYYNPDMWYQSNPEPGVTFSRTDFKAARHVAHVVSRGLFFNQIYAKAENKSLKRGVPDNYWKDVDKLARKGALLDPIEETDASENVLLKNFGISRGKWQIARGWAEYLKSDISKGDVLINALGLPYGHVATPWRPPYESSEQENDPNDDDDSSENEFQSMQYIIDNWDTVRQRVHEINAVAQTHRTEVDINDINKDRLNEIIDTTQGFIEKVGKAASGLSSAAGSAVSSQEQAIGRIKVSIEDLEAAQEQLNKEVQRIWECQDYANSDDSVITEDCVNNMYASLHKLQRQCMQDDDGKNYFGAIMDGLGMVIPYIGAASKILEIKKISKLAEIDYDDFDKDLSKVQESVDKVTEAGKYVGKAYEIIESQVTTTQMVDEIIKEDLPHCGEDEKVKAQLQEMATLNGLFEVYAGSVGAFNGVILGIKGHIAHLLVTKDIYNTLAKESDESFKQFSKLRDIKIGGKKNLNNRAKWLKRVCRPTVAATRKLQADLFHMSKLLQTTTGDAWVGPLLHVPSDSFTPDDIDDSYNAGYLTSVWAPSYFDQGMYGAESFLDFAKDRFLDFQDSVCDKEIRGIPRTRLVVRKLITRDQLMKLRDRGAGAINVFLTVDDIIRAGRGSIKNGINGILAKNFHDKTWHPLSAPVLLDAQYSICTGGPEDPCCDDESCHTTTNGPLFLIKTGNSLVPTLSCGPTSLSDAVLEPQHARVDSCMQPVLTTKTGVYMESEDLYKGDEGVLDSIMPSFCSQDSQSIRWQRLCGFPALGGWSITLTREDGKKIIEGAEPEVIDPPEDMSGFEIAFILMMEPETKAPAEHAYSIIDCVPEIRNGLDDDCNGLIDDGLSPESMSIEGEGDPVIDGGWSILYGNNGDLSYVSNNTTEGESALSVQSNSTVQFAGPDFMMSDLSEVGDRVLIDLFLADGQPFPYWYGDLHVILHIPDADSNSYNYLQKASNTPQLSSLPLNTWSTLSFVVPPNLKRLLLENDGIVYFSFQIDMPSGAPPMLLDNLRFGGNITQRDSNAPTRGSLDEILSFETIDDWSVNGGDIRLDDNLVTHGDFGLYVNAMSTYTTISSSAIRTDEFDVIPSSMSIDVWQQSKPSWGYFTFRAQCPLDTEIWVGQVSLSNKSSQKFNKFTYQLPQSLQDAIASSYYQCNFAFSMNAPSGHQIALDNIRFQ